MSEISSFCLRKKIVGLAILMAVQITGGMAYAGGKITAGDNEWISVGLGIRTSFSSVQDQAANGTSRSKSFDLDNARIYLNGQINKYVQFEFNTECIFCSVPALRRYTVLDAIGKITLSPAFNVWVGRMLVPADRAEMSGPFYANTYEFNKTPFYPADFSTKFGTGGAGIFGRDNGVTVSGALGSEGSFTYAVGIFSGLRGGSNQTDSLLYGARLSYNLLNVEKNPGYYTSSTYYGGAGDIFTVGFAIQHQQDGAGTKLNPANFTGFSVDVLSETVFSNEGVMTVEGEYKNFNTTLNAAALADPASFNMFDGDSWTGTGLYLIPVEIGIGKFQPYARYTYINPNNSAKRSEYEFGINYIISGHKARISMLFERGDIATKGLNYTPTAVGKRVNAFKVGAQFQY